MKKSFRGQLRFKESRRRLLLPLIFIAFLGLLGWVFYSHSFESGLAKKGSLAEDQQFPTAPETAHRNLDLKIASEAHYDSQPLENVKSFGSNGGVKFSSVRFKVSVDSLTEYGFMSRPVAPPPAAGYPVIVLCHSYAKPADYRSSVAYYSDMKFYSQHGFVVIKPDYRGQGLSRKAGKPEGAYYSMAYNTDVLSLISAVKQTKGLDAGNISLWGHSMGAYVALRAAVISPDVKNVILLSGPVGTYRDMYSAYIPVSDRTNPAASNIRQSVLLRYGNPLTNASFWQTTSPLAYLDKLKANVQIHVGNADTVVPSRFSIELNRALSSIHKTHEFFIYDGGRHGLEKERSLIYSRSLAVLAAQAPR